ncbi:MAG TPA: hypothetical protein VGS57_17435 [Thermoanaerobaculia bacterium]|nr:hypothetical protein [Thermoanaerobaculia bacterium]
MVKLKSSTMPGLATTERTAIVRVDEIQQAPEALADTAGMEITLQLGGQKKAAPGQQYVFYANGWLFGEGIACQSIDHQPAAAAPLALAAAAGGDPVEALAQRDAHQRVESADVVVSGRVRSVSLPPAPAAAQAAALSGSTTSTAVSEHDPFVQEAEVEVDAVHKGSHSGNTLRVRFPNSRDVKWYKAPKFRAGQEGLFILHKDEAKKAPQKAAAGMVSAAAVGEEVEDGVYTALHPADFQPAEQSGAVMSAVAAATGAVVNPK